MKSNWIITGNNPWRQKCWTTCLTTRILSSGRTKSNRLLLKKTRKICSNGKWTWIRLRKKWSGWIFKSNTRKEKLSQGIKLIVAESNFLNETLSEGTDLLSVQYMEPPHFFQCLVGKAFHGYMDDIFFMVSGQTSPGYGRKHRGNDGDVFFAGMEKRGF